MMVPIIGQTPSERLHFLTKDERRSYIMELVDKGFISEEEALRIAEKLAQEAQDAADANINRDGKEL